MGAVIILCALLMLLPGCVDRSPNFEYHPYFRTDQGRVFQDGIVTTDQGGTYARTIADRQVLHWLPAETNEPLTHTYLNFYDGDIYSLSNYRSTLLSSGYSIFSSEITPQLLDEILYDGTEYVRLIYQESGTIRILDEGEDSRAHILLKGEKRNAG